MAPIHELIAALVAGLLAQAGDRIPSSGASHTEAWISLAIVAVILAAVYLALRHVPPRQP